MKKIITTNIASGVRQPLTKYSLDHLQQSYTEVAAALAQSIGAPSGGFTVIYGCINTGTFPVYSVSAGAIYYNGEVYLVDSFSFTASIGVAVGTITTTYIAQDPLTFTDNSTHNVHAIIKIVFSDAISGSGDVDFLNLIFIRRWQTYIPVLSDVSVSGGSISSLNAGSHIFYYRDAGTIKIRFHITGTVTNNVISQLKLNMASIISAFDNGANQPNGINGAICFFGANPDCRVTFENNGTHLIFDNYQTTVLATGTSIDLAGEITVQTS